MHRIVGDRGAASVAAQAGRLAKQSVISSDPDILDPCAAGDAPVITPGYGPLMLWLGLVVPAPHRREELAPQSARAAFRELGTWRRIDKLQPM